MEINSNQNSIPIENFSTDNTDNNNSNNSVTYKMYISEGVG